MTFLNDTRNISESKNRQYHWYSLRSYTNIFKIYLNSLLAQAVNNLCFTLLRRGHTLDIPLCKRYLHDLDGLQHLPTYSNMFQQIIPRIWMIHHDTPWYTTQFLFCPSLYPSFPASILLCVELLVRRPLARFSVGIASTNILPAIYLKIQFIILHAS